MTKKQSLSPSEQKTMQKAIDSIHDIFGTQLVLLFKMTETIENDNDAIESAKKMLDMKNVPIDSENIKSSLRAMVQQLGEVYLEHEASLFIIMHESHHDMLKMLLSRIRRYQARSAIMREIYVEFMENNKSKETH